MVKGYIHDPVYEGKSRVLLEAGLSVLLLVVMEKGREG